MLLAWAPGWLCTLTAPRTGLLLAGTTKSLLPHLCHGISAGEELCLACPTHISAACQHSSISFAPCTCLQLAAAATAALHLDCARHILAACQCGQQRQADAWQRLPQSLIDVLLSGCLICSSLPHGVRAVCCAGITYSSKRASKPIQIAVIHPLALTRQCSQSAPATLTRAPWCNSACRRAALSQ